MCSRSDEGDENSARTSARLKFENSALNRSDNVDLLTTNVKHINIIVINIIVIIIIVVIIIIMIIIILVGGVAQWLERRSLTSELSLIYACSMVDK